MVESALTSPGIAIVAPSLGDSPATNASIAAYMGAGERMQTLMDLTWKTCAVLLALIVIAWALGMLPGAIPL